MICLRLGPIRHTHPAYMDSATPPQSISTPTQSPPPITIIAPTAPTGIPVTAAPPFAVAALAAELAALLTPLVPLPRIPPFELVRPEEELESLLIVIEDIELALLSLLVLVARVIEPAPLAIEMAVVPEREAAVDWAWVWRVRRAMRVERVRRCMVGECEDEGDGLVF